MECPNCGYKDGWDNRVSDIVNGEEGNFFRASNSIEMERIDSEPKIITGCPKCSRIFMA